MKAQCDFTRGHCLLYSLKFAQVPGFTLCPLFPAKRILIISFMNISYCEIAQRIATLWTFPKLQSFLWDFFSSCYFHSGLFPPKAYSFYVFSLLEHFFVRYVEFFCNQKFADVNKKTLLPSFLVVCCQVKIVKL